MERGGPADNQSLNYEGFTDNNLHFEFHPGAKWQLVQLLKQEFSKWIEMQLHYI